jgi:hypothetical protein
LENDAAFQLLALDERKKADFELCSISSPTIVWDPV